MHGSRENQIPPRSGHLAIKVPPAKNDLTVGFCGGTGPQILGINNIAREDTLSLNSLNQQLNRIANFRKLHPAMTSSFSEGIFAICAESRFRCAVTASGGTRLSQLFKETSTN